MFLDKASFYANYKPAKAEQNKELHDNCIEHNELEHVIELFLDRQVEQHFSKSPQ